MGKAKTALERIEIPSSLVKAGMDGYGSTWRGKLSEPIMGLAVAYYKQTPFGGIRERDKWIKQKLLTSTLCKDVSNEDIEDAICFTLGEPTNLDTFKQRLASADFILDMLLERLGEEFLGKDIKVKEYVNTVLQCLEFKMKVGKEIERLGPGVDSGRGKSISERDEIESNLKRLLGSNPTIERELKASSLYGAGNSES